MELGNAPANSPPPSAPPSQSPPPAPAPAAPSPSAGTGGVGVTPPPGATPAAVPTQTPQSNLGTAPQTPAIPADVQAQLQRYQQMEGEYNQLSQFKHLIPLGYKAYQQAGQQPNQPAAPQQPEHPWGLPAFDQRLLDFVARDPQTGRMTVLPGGPPDAAIRVEEYQSKLREVQTQLFTDPMKLLGPLIEKKAQEIARTQFQENFGAVQQQQATNQIIESNRDWLFAKDAAGNPVTQFDPMTGQSKPTLSPYGQQYVRFVKRAVQAGVQDPQAQHDFAVQGLQNLLFQQRFAAAQGQQQGDQQAQQFVQNAAQQTAAQALANHAPNTTPTVQPPSDLREEMRRAMRGGGVTDDTLRQQLV
ncbi:MAG TPA: hypothetical protein VMZ71_09100 [Gemmataceae bacterium]|nr:hypothetical protein [Gemmataceae bacterium]